jgi:hypothetical protein
MVGRPIREFLAAVTRSPLGLLGAALTTASAVLFLSLFLIESIGVHGGPYLGIITFMVLPGVFLLGLVLIPAGAWLERRRLRRTGAVSDRFPVIDLNRPAVRNLALVFLVATVVNLVIVSAATYKGVEYMETVEFCGQACHSVMDPEYTTYQRSPHSRVACVECHIGPGADWFVKSKLSGSWQVVSVNLGLYPKPIPTPVHSLRPARETCEQCHWPTKFVGDRLKVITHFEEDEANTETKTVLVLRVGGSDGTKSHGIHWHVDPTHEVRYRSTKDRETMYEVTFEDASGTRRRWARPAGDANGDAPKAETTEWRTMDCVDCHNRPSHIYRLPHVELDRAIHEGRIDRNLPFIRREGLAALKADYPSHEEARKGIAAAIRAFYEKEYPQVVVSSSEQIRQAGHTLGDIWCWNVFPSMNITWGTYPNHIGHEETPGCFRCHGSDLVDEAGEPISGDCETCHGILAMQEPNPPILSDLGR